MIFASADYFYVPYLNGEDATKSWAKTLNSFWWYWLADMGGAIESMEKHYKNPLAQLFYFFISVVISMLFVNVILAIMIELWESVH
jgi:hypothetical protein